MGSANIMFLISESGLRGLSKILDKSCRHEKSKRRYDLKMEIAYWRKDGMCQGYIFMRQKYKLKVKAVGENSWEKTVLWWKGKKHLPTHWRWEVATKTKMTEILREKEKKRKEKKHIRFIVEPRIVIVRIMEEIYSV